MRSIRGSVCAYGECVSQNPPHISYMPSPLFLTLYYSILLASSSSSSMTNETQAFFLTLQHVSHTPGERTFTKHTQLSSYTFTKPLLFPSPDLRYPSSLPIKRKKSFNEYKGRAGAALPLILITFSSHTLFLLPTLFYSYPTVCHSDINNRALHGPLHTPTPSRCQPICAHSSFKRARNPRTRPHTIVYP